MNVGAVIVAAQDLTQDKMGNEELETFLPMLSLDGNQKRNLYSPKGRNITDYCSWRLSGSSAEKPYLPQRRDFCRRSGV